MVNAVVVSTMQMNTDEHCRFYTLHFSDVTFIENTSATVKQLMLRSNISLCKVNEFINVATRVVKNELVPNIDRLL